VDAAFMKIDGGCHCGHIAYEAQVDAERVGICHCTDCQTLSGSAFRTFVLAPKETFRLLTGTPKLYVKTAESGAQRLQAFCPECGSPIYSAEPDNPSFFSIRAGTARQRKELVPKVQIWCRSALPWLGELRAITSFPQQPPLPR
jgi:hypothetical protein